MPETLDQATDLLASVVKAVMALLPLRMSAAMALATERSFSFFAITYALEGCIFQASIDCSCILLNMYLMHELAN